jgi:hypothetical protein
MVDNTLSLIPHDAGKWAASAYEPEAYVIIDIERTINNYAAAEYFGSSGLVNRRKSGPKLIPLP